MKTTLSKIIGSAVLATGVALASTSFAPANAATFKTTFNEFTGDDATAEMFLEDVTYEGKQAVQFDVKVLQTKNSSGVGTGDIRGFFFDILNNNLLTNLGVTGTNLPVTNLTKSADSVTSAGGGNTMNGGPGLKFDVGFGLGSSGSSGGIVSQTRFTVFNTKFDLTTAEFMNQDFGLRLQSTGANRQGSSKLLASGITAQVVTPPPAEVPEPATLVGLGLAFAGMLSMRRKSH